MHLNERFKLKFPPVFAWGSWKSNRKRTGRRNAHHSFGDTVSFVTHAVMQLAALKKNNMTHTVNNKAPVKRDWIGSFPHYFHTTTHTKTRPEPNSTNQALQLVSTKVETWFPNISQWAKSRMLLGTLEEWLIGFHCFSCWIFDIPTPFLTSFQLPA